MKFPWWDMTSVSLFDQILFLPHVMEKYSLDLPAQLSLEFCSGNGSWIVDKALANPGQLWVGVEKKFDRARKIWHRAKRLNAQNLLVVCGSAENFVNFVLADGSIEEVFINFPDPWPKRKHAKHRLMKEDFIVALKGKMKKEGTLTFVTDDFPYLQEALGVLHKTLKPLLSSPFYGNASQSYGNSFFRELWEKDQKPIYNTIYANY